MSTTTVNVNCDDDAPSTPGAFNVRAFYTETDAGHLFGPFSTKEKAEQCLIVLAARTTVIKANLEDAV